MENWNESWLGEQGENRDNLPTSSSALNDPESAAYSETMLQSLQSTLMMSGAFPLTTEGSPHGVAISEVVPHGLSGPALGSDALMATLTILPEAPIEHHGGQLSGGEPHLAATLQQQHADPFAPDLITTPATAQPTDNQLVDLLSPIVSKLYVMGRLINPLVGSEEIAYIQHHHTSRG